MVRQDTTVSTQNESGETTLALTTSVPASCILEVSAFASLSESLSDGFACAKAACQHRQQDLGVKTWSHEHV